MAAIRKFEDIQGTETFFVGETADIKSLYKALTGRKNSPYCPKYLGEFPIFSEMKTIYALGVDENGWVSVVNSDTMLSLILAGDVIPA